MKKLVKVGTYPTNEEFAEWFGVKADELSAKPKARVSFNLNEL